MTNCYLRPDSKKKQIIKFSHQKKKPKFLNYFLDRLEERLGKPIKYTIKTQQYCIWNNYLNAPNFYDVTCTDRKKIIEFNGDYWHCNPSKYDKDFEHLHIKKLASEIWKKDLLKQQVALDRGFSVKTVWWSEFETTPDEIIKECIEWLEQ